MARSELHALLRSIQHSLYVSVRAVCVALLALIVISISAAVLARFVIFTPLNFADPLSKYLMQWMAFLGLGMAMCRSEHVVVSAFSDRLSVPARKRLGLVICLLVAALFVVILIYGWQYAISGWNSSDPFVFGVPMIVPYLSVPAGALYALIQSLLSAGIILTGRDDEDPLPHAATQGI
ncbi:TRAP transporter small permease [Paracoccus albus]|uniref:TRAP transporter small permease n=1 Tax=Paracoccus albus TaxID=3017784 RepID=UPI0022EFFA11|nr:TRAP transporter small permease [Paracoccus albus]WBU62139.1 TRAP transporter small permease [Paracoccus albus]